MSAPNYNYQSPNYYEFDEFRNRSSKWRGVWVVDPFRVFERDGWKTRRAYKCSVCTSQFVGDGLFPTNYCPHCGADMRNEAEVSE